MEQKKDQHIAVLAVWYERYLECSRTFGTNMFPTSVWRFYHSLLNLGEEKLEIKKIVKDYIETQWRPKLIDLYEAECKKRRIDFKLPSHAGSRKTIYNENEKQIIVEIFEFMIQTIQNSGIGWGTKEDLSQYFISQE